MYMKLRAPGLTAETSLAKPERCDGQKLLACKHGNGYKHLKKKQWLNPSMVKIVSNASGMIFYGALRLCPQDSRHD